MNNTSKAHMADTKMNGESEILVSVLAPAYNHEAWIVKALEGIVAQKTKFPIEILVHDDASTDKTADIIREYEIRYPNLIKGVYQTENQYSQGGRAILILAEKARGKYLAICECDDYWTDPLKLQKQVALLEAHPECSMCVAQSDVYALENGQFVYQQTLQGYDKELLYIDDFIKGCYLHTSTYLIPAQNYRKVRKYWEHISYSDTALRYVLLDIGPFVLLREVVSVYQITGTGIWTGRNQYEKEWLHIKLYEMLYRHFNRKYRILFAKILIRYYARIILFCIKERRYNRIYKSVFRLTFLWFRYEPQYPLILLTNYLFQYKQNKIRSNSAEHAKVHQKKPGNRNR